MECGKRGYFIKDYRNKDTNIAKGTSIPEDDNKVRGIREYLIRYFTFCYNNACRIHKDAKYGASF